MKTKQSKEELEKSADEDTAVEPKTRARKKADEEDKNKITQDEPKTSKEPKKNVGKPKAIVKKKPLGIRKALRSKKPVATKDAVKNVIKQVVKRGRKPAIKTEPEPLPAEKETEPLIPVSEIKKEPVDETTPNSRSSSPRTAGRRSRLSSDMIMMKSVLADSPSTLVHGPRTSPYSMRSERSNSPSLFDGKSLPASKSLRSSKPRKAKTNLLNEVVIKEQKKRRRLLSDSKAPETEGLEDCKKLKRGRSCSRDGSEISKCSDITESDLSLSEPLNDTDNKELKKFDKAKTDLDIDIENNLQISSIEKVPSLNDDSKLAETKPDTEPSCITEKTKKSLSLKRSTSLDSDNNNSNRIKLDNLNSSDIEDKSMMKTENHTLFESRSSILSSMSKTFNSKEVSKNIRKARRGRKAAAATRTNSSPGIKNGVSATPAPPPEEKVETLESLSKEIDDLINNLDQNINSDTQLTNYKTSTENSDQLLTKPTKPASKALSESNIIVAPDTPVKDKDIISITTESTPSKIDDSENIRLHYEEDSTEKSIDSPKQEITYKHPVASIDKLMDRLKEFEEFDKRRQRQESESNKTDTKTVMVTNDVVLIPKSGADIKLKDIQTVRSPERPMEKENVLSCFENNSAISIVKRDQVRKSIDLDLPNSVTLIKRNSISSRKESTSSNHSKETDTISIFEKSFGKDVTLTEIRKSVDKTPPAQVDIHQFATLHPNNPSQSLITFDSNQISILPRVTNDVQITKRSSRSSRESISRKSSESGNDEAMATLEKIKSPPHQVKNMEISITPNPVAIKSPETAPPAQAEALPPPPIESVKNATDETTIISKEKPEATETAEVAKVEGSKASETAEITKVEGSKASETAEVPKVEAEVEKPEVSSEKANEPDKMEIDEEVVAAKKTESVPEVEKTVPTAAAEYFSENTAENVANNIVEKASDKPVKEEKVKEETVKEETVKEEKAKSVKGEKGSKSARNSVESLPGPSSALHETPESQKRKENILRTLGLLTHKAAKEAKIEKAKEKERIYSGMMSNKNKAVKSGDYTGTLKTVIKLNRGSGDRERKKYRSSLKMTFQKSKHRGKPQPEEGQGANEDDTYYTIERREGIAAAGSDGGHRKPYSNRLNNHDGEVVPEPVEPKETLNLVIPEKASSFSIHPGRLCQDQCFYCGGKFGLFDTPCHIAQMKSAERQKKVLDNEEKLTIDSCLCDACYRHVDRRANCPSYRKRPVVAPRPSSLPAATPTTPQEKPPISPPVEEESEDEPESNPSTASGRPALCHATGCIKQADHSIRRKWLIKMRASVNKLLKLEGDYPGLHTIPLCGEHHSTLAPLLACALCRRKVTKHHNVHMLHSFSEINPLLKAAAIPVSFVEKPVLCKMCRYFCTLLQRPNHNQQHATAYWKKLLKIYNVEVPAQLEQELPIAQPQDNASTTQDDPKTSKSKKKDKNKSKQRKSSDPDKQDSENSSEKTESSPEKDKKVEEEKQQQNVEEDIESLISSNKIPVPGAKLDKPENPTQNENETDVYEFDMPMIAVDKQTELQYLLQKQNNPAQFLNKVPNMTGKQKNSGKVQNAIQKPGQQQRISDKNAKRLQKIGQIITQKDKAREDLEVFEEHSIFKNLSFTEECTIESIPNKKPADINTLKNKWQMSESFTQVKKNLSELSKKLPVEKDPQKTGPKYLNPVKRLETNPSISVRELFPGEEEMNLQCSIEFNNVKAVTPEGWEKCNTTIQYDVETKKLWSELQRPYGNQSSFLRHLILLEKYFRNGDLVLSQSATPHAANYSDSVQSRLRAYDNIVNDTPRRAEPAISLIEYRKKPTVNGKSLLKTNQNEQDKEIKKTMPPPGMIPAKPKPKSDKPKKQLPPELIAINTPNAQGRKAIQNVLHNIQQLVKGVSAADPTEVAAAPVPKFDPPPPVPKFDPPPPVPKFDPPPPVPKFDPPPPVPKFDPPPPAKVDTPKEKKEPSKEGAKDAPTKKSKPTSKPWRPTLMPITPENLAKIAREPTQTAVDGRQLPSLVQVMSSGKRYHITLQDYNKMCIMRREKLQQLQDGDKPKKSEDKETTVITELQPSTMLGNGGTVVQNIPQEKEPEKKEMPELTQISSNAATILKNVGLKNITIAPIPPKTATVTSQTNQAIVSSPSVLVTSNPLKLPQLGSSVSITSETILTPNLPIMSTSMIMPKIPKSLTVIPQTVVGSIPQNVVASVGQSMMPSVIPQMMMSQGMVVPTGMVVPQNVTMPQGIVVPQMMVPSSAAQIIATTETQRP